MAGHAKNVVITGSTKGIGNGMALEFLKRGHNVVISSRGQEAVNRALADLTRAAESGEATIIGIPCDVADYDQVVNLWTQAKNQLGHVDIWINNAGISNDSASIEDLPSAQFATVPTTNITGLMYGCQVALKGMQEQGEGAIYNFEGFGSSGQQNPSNHVYGATKNAVRYFTKALVKETRSGPVIIGYMSPGIVLTDLSFSDPSAIPPERWETVKKVFNILADKLETVCPFLVEGVLNNTRHGGRIDWLPRSKVIARFLRAPFHKRHIVEDWLDETRAEKAS